MTRWIVSITALLVVSSAFAGGGSNNYTNLGNSGWDKSHDDKYDNSGDKGNSYCDIPVKCDTPKNNNCVPEPASMATLAIGGISLLNSMRKKKRSG